MMGMARLTVSRWVETRRSIAPRLSAPTVATARTGMDVATKIFAVSRMIPLSVCQHSAPETTPIRQARAGREEGSRQAAVDADDLAGDVAGLLRAQEGDGGGDLLRVTGSPKRNGRDQLGAEGR